MTAKLPRISYPVPSNKNGHAFSSVDDLVSTLGGESSGLYLVGSQGMWHGGIHITDATIPWCALSTDSEAENEYCRELYKGEQFIRCMADGEIVAWRVCKDYESAAIEWRGEKLFLSTSFVLVKHYIQPGDTEESGLTFFTLYMNLAPYAAYKQQGSRVDRKVAGVQRYYASAEDLQAGRTAGKLEKDTVVTLSDTIVTRSSDQRQFTEVTITRETKNAAGNTLAAGTKVWTVSDQGNLKATESVPVPSWWAKCTPAYSNQSESVVNCTSRTNWAYYLSSDDVLQYKNAGRLVADFPLSYDPGNTAQQVIRPGKNSGDAERTFSLVTLGRDKDRLKKGDRVWVVSDGDSLTPVAPAASGSEPVFNEVYVPPSPVPVSAGDGLGHMGFYQLPEENGKRSRYQVHIECLSADDMEKFITNPGRAGEDAPVYLTWQTNVPLFDKCEQGMVAGSRKTKAPGILTLAKVPGADAEGVLLTGNNDAAYYQIRPEGGWLPAASIKKVSQYALGELGFVTLNKTPESFDLIDGIKQPNNVVKGILEQLYKAAEEETRTTHALNKYNYKRLLELIDSNQNGYYSEQEYLQAVHNVSYRDRLYRVIAKHASEWYYGKDDPLWKTYLETLTTDAPLWKTYLEEFLDKMTWMKAVCERGVALGAELWHMHPVVFLDAVSNNQNLIIFPLKVKPKNDINGVWKNYYWAASLSDSNASQAIFGRNRSEGNRKHAARDLYTDPSTEIVAICDGVVKSITAYYMGTSQITIEHKTNDSRRFFARYGEVDPDSITVNVGDKVSQGHIIAKTGLIISPETNRHPSIIAGQTVYMLHFEYYPGYESESPPNNTSDIPYRRRSDLCDPLEILLEGYENTFSENVKNGSRIDINQLQVSDEGKLFIKGWESFKSKPYNDSEGYCTIGYGHLIARCKCEDIVLSDDFKEGITRTRADELFEERLPTYVNELKSSVTVNLYQYEFDALVSLLFNLGSLRKAPLLKSKLNSGDYAGAADELLDITNGGTAGLVTRRRKEWNLFNNNVYDSSH
ncbi:glycoside hydrolase family protein [Trabulsiella odontotermitis]|uniref:glycoside hydrolase family protein n=1 Tax=Trabulsiella odontotermitis TaxID=379893 RepID=UPI0006BA43B6|nr:peptidoglycan DD-metalloendopeptidase family protein [Trabulsiella odontotermitis]